MSHQPYYRIDPLKVNVNKTTEVMSYAFAQRHNILAVEVREEEIVIASAQPFMAAWEGMLVQTLRGRRIIRVVANPQELTRYMLEFYTMARSVAKASDAGLEVSTVTNFEQMLELGQLKSPDANDAHIVNIVDWLLQYAFDQRASDIHIEPRRDKGHVRFRIDGVMHHVYELPPAVNAAVTSRLKILGRMDVAEKRRPQDGRVKTKSPDGDGDRTAPVDVADRVRRKDGRADLRPGRIAAQFPGARSRRRRQPALANDGRTPATASCW